MKIVNTNNNVKTSNDDYHCHHYFHSARFLVPYRYSVHSSVVLFSSLRLNLRTDRSCY